MNAAIIESTIGIFAIVDSNNIIETVLFPRNARLVAEKLENYGDGVVINELRMLLANLKDKGFNHFEFENSKIAENVFEELKINTSVVSQNENREFIQGNLDQIAYQKGFLEESEIIGDWLSQVNVELSKIRVRKAAEKNEHSIIQAIHLIDDLAKTASLFSSRIREWYSLHFPELNEVIDNHETYINLVNRIGRKESFSKQNMLQGGLSKNQIEEILAIAKASMGADLNDKDLNQIQRVGYAASILYETKKSLELFVESEAPNIAPNLCMLATPLLIARLLALGGGLRSLAMKPSSTIQVLGAEKAMFRSLMSGAKPPKHGIIFHHSFLQKAKRRNRGKTARALAGKLAIAARIDAFGGDFLGDKLKEDLEKRIGEIRKNRKASSQKSSARMKKRKHRKKPS